MSKLYWIKIAQEVCELFLLQFKKYTQGVSEKKFCWGTYYFFSQNSQENFKNSFKCFFLTKIKSYQIQPFNRYKKQKKLKQMFTSSNHMVIIFWSPRQLDGCLTKFSSTPHYLEVKLIFPWTIQQNLPYNYPIIRLSNGIVDSFLEQRPTLTYYNGPLPYPKTIYIPPLRHIHRLI